MGVSLNVDDRLSRAHSANQTRETDKVGRKYGVNELARKELNSGGPEPTTSSTKKQRERERKR